jgi:hypothetical protein
MALPEYFSKVKIVPTGGFTRGHKLLLVAFPMSIVAIDRVF